MSHEKDLIVHKKMYEMFIFPEQNVFEIGEKVMIRDCFNEISYGYIENFNVDGTIFIKKFFSDMGADYDRKFISKL